MSTTIDLDELVQETLRELEMEDLVAQAAIDSVRSPDRSLEFAVLIQLGWRPVYTRFFGEKFVSALAPHHVEAIEWHWVSRLAFLRGEHPDYLAYFPIWSRGHMKSTVAEYMVIIDACLSAHFEQPGFCLYVSRSKPKVQEHVSNIETLLSSEPVRYYFPDLSQVKRNEETNQQRRWTGTFLHTQANYVIKGGSLDSGMAGSRVEQTRPTFIVPDDIDGREDSAIIAENRFRQLTTEILPMGQGNTLTFFPQNLISTYSSMYRIQKGHARVLTNRKPTVPVPAVLNLVTEVRTVNGIVKDVYISGTPTWSVWDAQRIQDEIDREGLPAFLKECQHEVEQDREGLALQHYDDHVHVISRSEFARMFGTRLIPQRWFKYVFNDWARTNTKYHANVAGIVTVSGAESRLPGAVFLFAPMSFDAATAPEEVATRILTAIAPRFQVGGDIWTWEDLKRTTLQKTNLEKFITNTTELVEQRRSLLAKVIPQYSAPILEAQRYHLFRMSHERTDVKKIYRDVFGLPFSGINPGADGGLDTINLYMRVDYKTPHAFRPGQMGYTNFYVVADDDTTQEPVIIDGCEVYPPVPYNDALAPDDLHDADRCRYQFKHWRFRNPHLTVAGEKEGELLKMDDDFGNGLMMLFHDNAVFASPLTKQERVMEELPEAVKTATIEQLEDPQMKANRLAAQRILIDRGDREAHRPRTKNIMHTLRKRFENG